MKRIVEIPLATGGTVAIEVDDGPAQIPIKRGLLSKGTVEISSATLEARLESIRPAAEAIVSRLYEMTQKPDQIEVSFGIKIATEAGVFIASGSAEANFAVTLKWNGSASSR